LGASFDLRHRRIWRDLCTLSDKLFLSESSHASSVLARLQIFLKRSTPRTGCVPNWHSITKQQNVFDSSRGSRYPSAANHQQKE
jgi:hypothetical protein